MDTKQEYNTSPKKYKSRYISIVLYPDNPYHMEYLHYLEDTQKGFYIVHDFGDDLANVPLYGVVLDDNKKECYAKKHIHCMLIFENPRSEDGFLKSLPIVRYYQYERQEQLYTVYDIPYIGISDKANNASLVEINKPLLSKCEAVRDVYAHSIYFLHQDFKSHATGKKRYELSDIKTLHCSRDFIKKYFNVADLTDQELLDRIIQLWITSENIYTFLQVLSVHPNSSLLKYVQNHAYFVKNYILENCEVTKFD